MSRRPDIEELIEGPPNPATGSAVAVDDDRLVIAIEGRTKPRLPPHFITSIALFIAAAFICPGVFVVAAVLLPIALLVLGGIYLFRPALLERPFDTQMLIISPSEIRFYESCPRKLDARGPEPDQPPTALMARDNIASVELIDGNDSDDSDENRGIQITDHHGETIAFGQFLRSTDDPTHDDYRDRRGELSWLFEIVETHLFPS